MTRFDSRTSVFLRALHSLCTHFALTCLRVSQATGHGSLLSFVTGDVDVSQTIVEETELFKITVSFGNVASLISLPCFMSHASIPAEVRPPSL
eukprot:1180222-Prorocentrum_minimum.AAC.3